MLTPTPTPPERPSAISSAPVRAINLPPPPTLAQRVAAAVWKRRWGIAFAIAGAGLGASCPSWPEAWQPVCREMSKLARLIWGGF